MRVSGKQLAELLGVAAPTLSQAVTKHYRCRGYDVGAWAVLSPSGRVQGYDLPLSVAEALGTDRPNADPVPSLPSPAASGTLLMPQQLSTLLPPGQDYIRPAATLAAA